MSATKLTVGDVTITVEHTPQPTVTPPGAFPAHTYTEWSKDLVIGRLQQQEAENVKLANRCDELAREYSDALAQLRARAEVDTKRARSVEARWLDLLTVLDVNTHSDALRAIDALLKQSAESKAPRSKKGRAA